MKNKNLIAIASNSKGGGKDEVAKILLFLYSNRPEKDYGTYIDMKEDLECNSLTWDSPYQIKKFATPVKKIVCILLGCTMEDLEDRVFKESTAPEIFWYYSIKMKDEEPYKISYRSGTFEELADPYHSHKCEYHILIKPTVRDLIIKVAEEFFKNVFPKEVLPKLLLTESMYYDQNKDDIIENKIIISDLRFQSELKEINKHNGITIYVESSFGEDDNLSEISKDDVDYVIKNNKSHKKLFDEIKKLYDKLK